MEDNRIIDLYWAGLEDAITHTAQKYGKYCYIIAYNKPGFAQNEENPVCFFSV